jgi:predicted DsbA family dithiol-disulfide isomerase
MSPDEVPTPTVYVFYDYICPYAFIGTQRGLQLDREYDIDLEFLPWELYPTTAPGGEPVDEGSYPDEYLAYVDDLAAEVDTELEGPDGAINSNLALRAAEYARDRGPEAFRAYHTAAFDAVWREGRNVGDPDVLADVAGEAGLDPEALLAALDHNAYQARIDAIDQAARTLGVQRVPTFVFGDQRIVGNDPFERNLRAPLEAFLERWKRLGPELSSTLAHDIDLETILTEG